MVSAAQIGVLPEGLAAVHSESGTPRIATLVLALGLLPVLSLSLSLSPLALALTIHR